MKVGILQIDILWEDVQGNIEKVNSLLNNAKPGDFDLLILPELWSCGFTMNQEAHKTFEPGHACMKEIAERLDTLVLGGLPFKTETGQANRSYLVGKDHSLHYTKIKAFKFAGEHKKYQPGNETKRFECKDFQLSPFVCYDLRFPELARSKTPETTLYSYVACWPTPRVHHWRSLLMARAIENQAYVIGVNRVGRDGAGLDYPGSSMIIGPQGEIVLDCGEREGLYTAEIHAEHVTKTRDTFKFLNDMDTNWS